MSKVEPFPNLKQSEPNDLRERVMSAVLTLVEGLPPQEREALLRQVTERLRPVSVPLAGEVLGTVVQLLPRDRSWTVREIRKRVEENGIPITDKELYNAIGYLNRKNHIIRRGHGQYIINGVAVVTGDDFGGQPSITEGDLDD